MYIVKDSLNIAIPRIKDFLLLADDNRKVFIEIDLLTTGEWQMTLAVKGTEVDSIKSIDSKAIAKKAIELGFRLKFKNIEQRFLQEQVDNFLASQDQPRKG